MGHNARTGGNQGPTLRRRTDVPEGEGAPEKPSNWKTIFPTTNWWWTIFAVGMGPVLTLLVQSQSILFVTLPCLSLASWGLIARNQIKVRWKVLFCFLSTIAIASSCLLITARLPLSGLELYRIGRTFVAGVPRSASDIDELLGHKPISKAEMGWTAFWLDETFIATCSAATGERELGDHMFFLETTPVTNQSIGGGSSMTFTSSVPVYGNLVFNYDDVSIYRVANRPTMDQLKKSWFSTLDGLLRPSFYKTGAADLEGSLPESGEGVAVMAQEAGASWQNFLFREGVVESLENRVNPSGPLQGRMGISVEYRDGYCGAPVFNKHGKVVGMVVGKKSSGVTDAVLFTEIRMQWHQLVIGERSRRK